MRAARSRRLSGDGVITNIQPESRGHGAIRKLGHGEPGEPEVRFAEITTDLPEARFGTVL